MSHDLTQQALGRARAGEPRYLAAVREALARAPSPEQAHALADDLLAAADGPELDALAEEAPQRLGAVLLAVCGIAPFLAPYLRRRPEWLLALLREDLSQPRTRQALVAAAEALAADQDGEALRRLKYYELARITVRDCDETLVPLLRAGEPLRELSWLADALLERALELAAARVAQRFGPARWRNAAGADEDLGFCVLALGKLGGEELNYSSDVDLVYVYEAPALALDGAAHPGPAYATLPPAEYFTHVAQQFGRLLAETTAEGFLYRVDLDLRPEGAQGTLVVSDEALAAYYEAWADTWEKATFMKARPVAGDLGLGWRSIRAIDPIVYRSAMDYAAVAGIRRLKDKIAAAHGGRTQGFDVKLDAGGIRDVEFVAQALQLLHGGRIEQVRARSTQEALERLGDVRLLSASDSAALLTSYLFLRRLENRLQMHAERQTHALPAEPGARALVARALGFSGDGATADFERTLQCHRDRVRKHFEDVLFDGKSEHIFQLLSQRLPQLLATPLTRNMLEALAEQLAREIAQSGNPERALNNLDRFVQGVGQRRFYFELMLDRPELVPRLTALLASSSYLSAILARDPALIEPVFYDPHVLLLSPAQLDADFAAILDECSAREIELHAAQLGALRRFYHRQVINAGLLDLGGKVARAELESALTDVAQVCLARALDFAVDWLVARRPELSAAALSTRFAVIGMGKLASRELTYGSDLDLLFLFDVEGDDSELLAAQEYCTRLSQRLISLLSTRTAEGACYEIDARLRPSGNQGPLVSSLQGLQRYHLADAQLWERMALLRARPVAGDAELGARFEALRARALGRELPAGARADVLHVRRRMERELAREGPRVRDFKRGRGGLLDVESAVQYLQLRHGGAHPELLAALRVDAQLERLAGLQLLPSAQAAALREGWDFLQRLSARLRIVENRSMSDLDEERGDLEGLAKTLGYASDAREGGARRALLTDYLRHTEAVRAAFEHVLGAD